MKKQKPSKLLKEKLNDALSDRYSFFENVYAVVRKIPKGRVTTFGAIALYLGTRSSARMVGWALNGSHDVYPPVPAHRVVNRHGMLSGKAHFGTPSAMETLLSQEKVKVEEDTVVHFDQLFWDPVVELSLE